MLSGRRKFAVAVAAVAVAAGAFIVLKPGEDDHGTPPASVATTAAPAPATSVAAPPAAAQPRREVVRLRGGVPVGGVKTVAVESGERVRFDVRSDTPQEIHVHGFDVTKTAAPGSPARFRLEADIEGRFEVEVHASGIVIAEIAVRP